MTSISNSEVRHRILEILYNLAQQKPSSMMEDNSLQKLLEVSQEKMDFNALYLAEKGLVRLHWGFNKRWWAEITAYGVDVIENKKRYSEKFPFIQTTIQTIHGDVYGNVVQAVESKVDFNQQVSSAFQEALDIIISKKDIQLTLRNEIEKNLRLLEKELRSQEPDAGKIQKLWKWLKKNAIWVIPTLSHVVLEGLKMAFG